MAPSREIEKLQRRWQENPLGLTFAPLAEAYRKEGMLADAFELLDIGLSQHPSYVPAHIVKGRCYLDARGDADAERAFLRVIDLDPENVIALKGLAEIAERSGRFGDAIERLERLLEFDRNNEDARLQLDQLEVHRPIPADRDEGPVASEAAARSEELVVDDAATSPGKTPIEIPRAEIVDGARPDLEVVVFSPVELTANATSEYQELGDAESLDAASAAGADHADLDPPIPEPELRSVEPAPEEVIPVALPAEPEPALAEEELAAAEEELTPDAAEPEPALVVTETMAELFLRQGHRELALAVYTQLASRDPDNARIRGAIVRLEAEVGPPQSAVLPAYAAVLTGGQSVRAYFEQLLAARRPGAVPEGAELSLGSVFGDERGTAAASPAGGSDPSYDEFYADTSDPAPAAAVDPPATEEPQGDDLEGFTDWLRGLRR